MRRAGRAFAPAVLAAGAMALVLLPLIGLAQRARGLLESLGYSNVWIRVSPIPRAASSTSTGTLRSPATMLR